MPALIFAADHICRGQMGCSWHWELGGPFCPIYWWPERVTGAYPKHHDAKAACCAQQGCGWGPASLPSSQLPSLGCAQSPSTSAAICQKLGELPRGCPLGGCSVAGARRDPGDVATRMGRDHSSLSRDRSRPLMRWSWKGCSGYLLPWLLPAGSGLLPSV